MKTTIVAILMTLTVIHVSGQERKDTINMIEQKILTISQEKEYWTSTYKNEAFLDTGFIRQTGQGFGQLTGYFKNGKICKIRELVGLKLLHEIAITEYYFSEGKLIYVDEQEKSGPDILIDSEGTVDYRIKEPAFEARYYFNTDKIIHSIETGVRQTMLLPDQEFFDSQSKEGQLLLSAKKYYGLFSIKYK